jgi:uncharacterized damage-inducible protein DinB
MATTTTTTPTTRTAAATAGVLANGLGALTFSRTLLSTLIEDIPHDKLTHQPIPGTNHAIWVLGHIAYCDDLFRKVLGGARSTFPEDWKPLFKDGSEPTTDARGYPVMEELRRVAEQCRAELTQWFAGMSPEQLAAPLPKDWQPFARTMGELMSNIASHETFHAGQLSALRRSLKLKRHFG